jgi:TctA family transporter
MSRGDLTVFVTRPVSAALLLVALALLAQPLARGVMAWRPPGVAGARGGR